MAWAMADEAELRIRLKSLFYDMVQRAQERDHSRRVPEELHHYTSVEGLKGILDSGQIWATHTGYLNDSQEIFYGRDLALEEIRSVTDRAVMSNAMLHRVEKAVPEGIPGAELYVACFCEQGDLLSQWRGYGGRGSGYSIRLRPKGMVFARLPWKMCLLAQVCYDPKDQRQRIREILKHYLDSVEGYAANFTDQCIARYGRSILVDMIEPGTTLQSCLPRDCWMKCCNNM
jgi:hypothetical protein